MDIKSQEDALFEKWRNKHQKSSFVEDGCPRPEVYLSERKKFVFALNDANLGEPESVGKTFSQRDELKYEPNLWWSTIARWCHFLRFPRDAWKHVRSLYVEREEICKMMSHYCVVQIKKSWGTGSVSKGELNRVVTEEGDELREQFSLYGPDYIVCCGNGEHVSKLFGVTYEEQKETRSGIGYWEVVINGHESFLIDYCHPSNRAGTKVWGLIATGLASAVEEIEGSSESRDS